MFSKETYISRRERLMQKINDGVILLLGNSEASTNYPSNTYKFRQDSSFLYFFGHNEPDLAAVLDPQSGEQILFGNNVDMDDIIWMGPQPTVASKGALIGCQRTAPLAEFDKKVTDAVSKGRDIHFLPPARYYNQMKLSQLTGLSAEAVRKVGPVAVGGASEELVKAVVSMRLIKEACEIEEIDKACEIGYEMHTVSRQGCKPGVLEQEIV